MEVDDRAILQQVDAVFAAEVVSDQKIPVAGEEVDGHAGL